MPIIEDGNWAKFAFGEAVEHRVAKGGYTLITGVGASAEKYNGWSGELGHVRAKSKEHAKCFALANVLHLGSEHGFAGSPRQVDALQFATDMQIAIRRNQKMAGGKNLSGFIPEWHGFCQLDDHCLTTLRGPIARPLGLTFWIEI